MLPPLVQMVLRLQVVRAVRATTSQRSSREAHCLSAAAVAAVARLAAQAVHRSAVREDRLPQARRQALTRRRVAAVQERQTARLATAAQAAQESST